MATSIPSRPINMEPNTPLTESEFAPFGKVIECPLKPSTITFPASLPTLHKVVPANQDTALKFIDVTYMRNCYGSAPSNIPAKAVMNMFSCFPRLLGSTNKTDFPVDVKILERHPYTTQTFIPLGVGREAQGMYLVVVAPTLPPTGQSPFTTMGPPDLNKMRRFWAHGGQAVTYGVGTWHMPMAVVGEERMDFVVVQYANGVADEDCQEVRLVPPVQEKL
ncbi:MAG: hypothetical protein L6R42_007091 [Xanthoria sp. 1 TBL-2021]|nr:MAG: hypothetical protein L6R42_007091 [Xanthoria sp. 1 TBL-2021]